MDGVEDFIPEPLQSNNELMATNSSVNLVNRVADNFMPCDLLNQLFGSIYFSVFDQILLLRSKMKIWIIREIHSTV